MAPAQSSSPANSQLPSLPDGVVSLVLACLYTPYDILKTAKTPQQRHASHVFQFAFVCRAWYELIQEVASANLLSSFTVALPKLTRQSVLEMRRQQLMRRARTQRVNLHHAPKFDHIGDISQHWRALLSHAPHTTLLDLTTISKHSRTRLRPFLIAAGQSLPRVHSLHLPQYKIGAPFNDWMYEMTSAMLEALKLWSMCGDVDGIRVLRASVGDYMTSFDTSGEMVEMFARYCPMLERLEMSDGDGGICVEQWEIDLPSWTRFCAACSNLAEFDWVRVPFSTLFFEVFGQHPQPNLTKLTLRTAVNWDWDLYLSEADPNHRKAMIDRGFGGTSSNAFTVLNACPNLKELRVHWSFSLPPHDAKLNPEIFGDEFHENVVVLCPLLERFISASSSFSQTERTMIASLTDRSLGAFAKLSRLRFLEISAKNITGDALFNLVVNPAMEHRWTMREYRVVVGDASADSPTSVATFYDVVLRFVQRIAAVTDPSAFEGKNLLLRLVNNSAKTTGEAWYSIYLAQLRTLVAQIQATHPAVTMQIALVQEDDGVWGHQIAAFAFHTLDSSILPSYQGSFDHRQGNYDDEPIDAVFVRRFRDEFVWDGRDDEDDAMDEST